MLVRLHLFWNFDDDEGLSVVFWLATKKDRESTHPETNSSHLKWTVEIRSFPFGMANFQGRAVSFREDILKILLAIFWWNHPCLPT